MTENRRQVIMRIDEDLYEALAEWAQEDDRSVNQHLVRILRQAAESAGRWPSKAQSPRPPA